MMFAARDALTSRSETTTGTGLGRGTARRRPFDFALALATLGVTPVARAAPSVTRAAFATPAMAEIALESERALNPHYDSARAGLDRQLPGGGWTLTARVRHRN